MRHKTPAADRSSWEIRPASGPLLPVQYQDDFNSQELELLSLGLVPQEMEDKWFIFREDDEVFFHRSWTGHLVYQISLDGATVKSAYVVDDPSFYRRGTDDYEARLLRFLIRGLLLRQDVPFPVPENISNSPPGIFQHSIAGSGFPEDIVAVHHGAFERIVRGIRKLLGA